MNAFALLLCGSANCITSSAFALRLVYKHIHNFSQCTESSFRVFRGPFTVELYFVFVDCMLCCVCHFCSLPHALSTTNRTKSSRTHLFIPMSDSCVHALLREVSKREATQWKGSIACLHRDTV